mgnify:CR=1 FL=1
MMDFDFTMLQQIGYIASAILFIYGLKMLSSESSAAKGNMVCLLYTSDAADDC